MSAMLQTQKKAQIIKQCQSSVPPQLLQRKRACGGNPGVDGECTECRAKHLSIQRSATNQAGTSTVPPPVHDVLRSPGQPLDTGTRAFMEPRFRHNFSNVRIHTDGYAAESARSVNALAYTVGRDVVFGAGQYAPRTVQGQRLLAHELTHVVQQYAGAKQDRLSVGPVDDHYEHEAERAANDVVMGKTSSSNITVANQFIARQVQPGPMSLPKQPEQTLGPATPSLRGQAAAMIALSEEGVKEIPPGSNKGPCPPGVTRGCVDAYTHGRSEPWCANFVSWSFEQTGFSPFGHLRAVSALRNWAKSRGWYIESSQVEKGNFMPISGDIFTKGRYEGKGPERYLVGGHTGFVISYDPRHHRIHTIEGNTGDEVAQRRRNLSDLDGFIRIGA